MENKCQLTYELLSGEILEANLEKLLDYARLSLTYKSLVAAMSSIMGARLISSIVCTPTHCLHPLPSFRFSKILHASIVQSL